MYNFKKQTSPQGASAAAFLPHTGWKPQWEQIYLWDPQGWRGKGLVDRKARQPESISRDAKFQNNCRSKPWPFPPCRDWDSQGWRTRTFSVRALVLAPPDLQGPTACGKDRCFRRGWTVQSDNAIRTESWHFSVYNPSENSKLLVICRGE